MIIAFELCNPEKRDTCKSDEEIEKAISYTFIVTLENRQRYNIDISPEGVSQDGDDDNEIISSFCEMKWFAMSKYLG